MRVGDTVRLIGVPPGLRDDDDLQTKTLFQKCVGQSFAIVKLDTVEGLPYQLVELHVGYVVGVQDFVHSIWVEPEYLELVVPTDPPA